MGRRGLLALLVLASALALPARAPALSLEQIGTFQDPLYVTSDPGDPNRLFVVERRGQILLLQNGATSVFTDLSGVVNSVSDQQGLMSIALPSNFDQTGLLYVFYTGNDSGNLHIGELRASGQTADPATLRNVITIGHSDGVGHNGGQIQFGHDGYLYISTGDGKCCGDPLNNGQNLSSLLGKILRIDPRQNGAAPYTVPADNPFVGTSFAPEIWSYGLRNPWRFSFDRGTGALVIGDVGNSQYEEVDYEPPSAGMGRGDNFGWRCREGMHDFNTTGCSGPYTDPIFEYPHTGGGSCTDAITGGFVVRDPGLPDLAGRYLYGDFCDSRLHSLVPGLPFASGDRAEPFSVLNPVSFGEDSCGRIYVVAWAGEVYRVVGAAPTDCSSHAAARAPINLRLKPARHRVARGKRDALTAIVKPCAGRAGESVRLFRGKKKIGTRALSAACQAVFKPRIRHRSSYRARLAGSLDHLSAASNRVRVKVR
jgi:hypothetical protein